MTIKLGRPSKYTPNLAKQICDIVSTETMGLCALCKIHTFLPSQSTIRKWRNENADFSAQYARAKLQQADILAEECLEIADDDSRDHLDQGSIARDRLKIDTRKWLASKLLPKQYGDKYVSDLKENVEDAQENEVRKKLRAELDAKNRKDY